MFVCIVMLYDDSVVVYYICVLVYCDGECVVCCGDVFDICCVLCGGVFGVIDVDMVCCLC